MTGSMWVPIVVPIVALIALASWLGMVYHAAAHPQVRHPAAGAGATGQEVAAPASAPLSPGREADRSGAPEHYDPAPRGAVPDDAGHGETAHGDSPRPARPQAGRHAA